MGDRIRHGLFFEKLDLEDKTLQVYYGRYHEIYNESEDLWQ